MYRTLVGSSPYIMNAHAHNLICSREWSILDFVSNDNFTGLYTREYGYLAAINGKYAAPASTFVSKSGDTGALP